jgi:hypothetical protein
MSLATMISQSKEALETLMITIPDGPADDSDYEIWAKKFSTLLVRPLRRSHNIQQLISRLDRI